MTITTISQVVIIFFRFIFTPGLLIGTTIWASSLTSEKTARAYAFWLGIFIAILVIVINLLSNPKIVFIPDASASFTPNAGRIVINVVGGLFAGLGAMAITRFLDYMKAASLVITAISAASLIGIYYVFIGSALRDSILIIALSKNRAKALSPAGDANGTNSCHAAIYCRILLA